MKFTTKQIARTGILLALCIVSQFFKNLSVYLTGPIINAVLIIAVLSVGLSCGLLIAVITPVTAYLIAPSPIIASIPPVMVMIMLGNCILVLCVWLFYTKFKFSGKLIAGLLTGSALKACFMTAAVTGILFSVFGEALKPQQIAMGKIMFSTTQLITALTGSLLAFLIWLPLKKFLKAEN